MNFASAILAARMNLALPQFSYHNPLRRVLCAVLLFRRPAVVPENLDRLIQLLQLQRFLENRDRTDLKNPIKHLAIRVTRNHDDIELRVNLLG